MKSPWPLSNNTSNSTWIAKFTPKTFARPPSRPRFFSTKIALSTTTKSCPTLKIVCWGAETFWNRTSTSFTLKSRPRPSIKSAHLLLVTIVTATSPPRVWNAPKPSPQRANRKSPRVKKPVMTTRVSLEVAVKQQVDENNNEVEVYSSLDFAQFNELKQESLPLRATLISVWAWSSLLCKCAKF